jgi:serine/threonine-protein kinase
MIGRIVGDKYELVQEIGSDSVFDTFRGMDRGRNRPVKIRLIRPQAAQEESFIRELQDVVDQHHTHFQHPSLERVFEMREDDGIWFIASEFEEGSILEERLKRLSSFSVPVAVGLAISIAEALEACHASGLIHGDISARTVFSKQGEGVKLMQAGFWQAYRFSEAAARQMMPAMAPYLAPEITAGSMPGKASDIYSLGVLLYRLLTGRYPYSGDSPQSYAEQHLSAPYPSLKRSLASVPPALDEIVKKCLARRPDERYATATELLHDLRLLQDALRFGRSLKWPLVEPSPDEPVTPVAPAIEDPEKPAKPVRQRERIKNEGIPLWLSIIGYLSTFLMLAAVSFWIYYNTNSANREVKVPNLVGKTFTDAAEELEGLNLKIRKKGEKVSDEAQDVILETNPAALRTARENSFIDVVVSAGSKFVELPDLKGKNIDIATGMLDELKILYETRVKRDRDFDENEVVEQSPSPKARVERGTKVILYVNKKEAPPTSRRSLFTYKLDIEMPTGSAPIKVRITMTDGLSTSTIHEKEHMPSETFQVTADGHGEKATFRIYFDEALVETINKDAEPKEENHDE